MRVYSDYFKRLMGCMETEQSSSSRALRGNTKVNFSGATLAAENTPLLKWQQHSFLFLLLYHPGFDIFFKHTQRDGTIFQNCIVEAANIKIISQFSCCPSTEFFDF